MVAEVLFPNAGVPFGGFGESAQHDLRAAGNRAYDRWLLDFANDAPGRRAALAMLTVHDLDATVAEITWARENGMRGVIIPTVPGDGLPPYYDQCYDQMWAACQDHEMPVHIHGGSGTPNYGDYGAASMLIYATETVYFAHRPLWFLIWGGVLERHPRMKLVFTESRCDWVPSTLTYLDGIYAQRFFSHIRETVKLKPSEYWERQCSRRGVVHGPRRVGDAPRDRAREADVGRRLPPRRGHVAAHAEVARRGASTASRSTRPARSSPTTRRACTASTSPRSSPSPTACAPRPRNSRASPDRPPLPRYESLRKARRDCSFDGSRVDRPALDARRDRRRVLRPARRGIGSRRARRPRRRTRSPSASSRRSTAGSPASARASATRSSLAVQQANATNPIKGWTIKVRVLDDSSDPDKGAAAAKKLAADPTVVAVVGPYNSGVAQSVLPVLAKRGHRARLAVEHAHVAHARRKSPRSRGARSRTTSASSDPTRRRPSSSPSKPAHSASRTWPS